jgi:prolyl-tRNA synthetase
MRLPVLVAEASSGDMGGDLSHEYHLPTSLGEDHVVSCHSCGYSINDELAKAAVVDKASSTSEPRVWRGITKDRSTLVNVWYPGSTRASSEEHQRTYTDDDINVYAVKSVVPDLDAGIEDPLPFWMAATSGPEPTAKKLVNIVDCRWPPEFLEQLHGGDPVTLIWPDGVDGSTIPATTHLATDKMQLNMIRIRSGDPCPKCDHGTLDVQKAIELGHTFHLGTRYSVPLEAHLSVPSTVALDSETAGPDAAGVPDKDALQTVHMQMGCHGIGVSRIIGAVADHLADARGLNWPAAIAPYSCVVVPGRAEVPKDVNEAIEVCELLSSADGRNDGRLDIIVDDRQGSLPRRLTDIDLIGIPIILVLGREWRRSQRVEVQCRRLNVTKHVALDALPQAVENLLEKL